VFCFVLCSVADLSFNNPEFTRSAVTRHGTRSFMPCIKFRQPGIVVGYASFKD
jgi:hypothetical protein